MRQFALLLGFAAVTACTMGPPPPRTNPEAEAKLRSLLAGKVPGQPVSCVPRFRADNMITIDEDTLAFKDGGYVYVAQINGACDRLGRAPYALVTRSPTGSGICTGELATVVDTSTGVTVGSCAIGTITPFRQP